MITPLEQVKNRLRERLDGSDDEHYRDAMSAALNELDEIEVRGTVPLRSTLRIAPTYVLQLTQNDLLLVLRGLRGGLQEHELSEALALCDSLTRVRADELERTVRQLRLAAGVEN